MGAGCRIVDFSLNSVNWRVVAPSRMLTLRRRIVILELLVQGVQMYGLRWLRSRRRLNAERST